jgi:hypothetical protein
MECCSSSLAGQLENLVLEVLIHGMNQSTSKLTAESSFLGFASKEEWHQTFHPSSNFFEMSLWKSSIAGKQRFGDY